MIIFKLMEWMLSSWLMGLRVRLNIWNNSELGCRKILLILGQDWRLWVRRGREVRVGLGRFSNFIKRVPLITI